MTISVSCDECFQEYRLNDTLAGKKVKCKECGAVIQVPAADVDDVEFLDDDLEDDADDEDDYVAPSKRKGGNRPPPVPKAKARRVETPPPIPSKKAGKTKKKSSGYRDPLDDVPTWVVLTVMWTVIGVMCILFWVLGGKGGGLQAANGPGPNLNQPFGAAGMGVPAGPVAPAALFPVANVPVPALPDLPPLAQVLTPPSLTTSITLPAGIGPGASSQMRIWMPQGQHALHALGCVFMPPHEANFLSGAAIGDVSDPEALKEAFPLLQPCLSAGFAVVAFSVDGELQGLENLGSDFSALQKLHRDAYQRFQAGQVGLVNLRNAVEWVSTKVHQIDPARLYIGGVNEAGSLALLGAAHEPRLKGCVVVDPVCNVAAHYAMEYEDVDEMPVPEAITNQAFLGQCSPSAQIPHIQCPVFLASISYDDDESEQPTLADNNQFVQQMSGAGKPIQFVKIGPAGDYNVNQDQVALQGVAWLKTLTAEKLMP